MSFKEKSFNFLIRHARNLFIAATLVIFIINTVSAQILPHTFVDLGGKIFSIPREYLVFFSGSRSSESHPIKVSSFAFSYRMPDGRPAPTHTANSSSSESDKTITTPVITAHSVEKWSGENGDYAGRNFTNALRWAGLDDYTISSAHGLIRAEPISTSDGQTIWLLGTKQIYLEEKPFWISSITRCAISGGQCISDVYIETMSLKVRIVFPKESIDQYWEITQNLVSLLSQWATLPR